MQTGTIISGAGHAALILWVILGDWLFSPQDAPAVEVAEVSLISSAEFDAMVAAAPSTPEPEVAPEPAPEPPAEVEPAPQVEPPAPVQPELPEPTPAEPPEEALPELEPVPEALPENNGVADALPLPVNPDPIPESPLPPTASPRPKPAPRVAPVPVDAPAPTAEVAEVPEEAVTPDPVEQPQIVEPERAEAQPEEAGTVLETEANREEDVVASGAPPSSPRPKGRPVRRAAAETPAAPVVEEPPPEPEVDTDAIAGALAEAAAEEAPAEEPSTDGGATNAPQGPPITGGERDALRVAVQQCWNVGSLSTDALNTTVVVYVAVGQTGVPDAASIRLIESTGGTEAGARGAFEAARRAIIRCGAKGFPLPPEKYDQWREMELVFNPEGMRMR